MVMAIKLSYTMFCWGEKRREVCKKKNKNFPLFGRGDKFGRGGGGMKMGWVIFHLGSQISTLGEKCGMKM